MKKLLLVLLIILSLTLVLTLADDEFIVATKFTGQDGEGYWGPYGPAYTIKDGVLIFDSSIPNAWMTLNFKDDFMEADDYRYVVITVRADDPKDAQNVLVTFGNLKKTFTEWGITLSTNFTTYIIDLKAHGLKNWGDGTKAEPDFALNKHNANKAKVYVQSIILTNNPAKYKK